MTHRTLQAARDDKRWTQEDLARESGLTQSAISKLERGNVTDPQKSTVDALESALGLKPGTLVFGHQERVSA